MNDPSAVTPIRLRAQEDTLSVDATATAPHGMSQVESPLVRELRKVIAGLQDRIDAQERHIEELRGAVIALMEPGMPRILRTPGGIMVLDKNNAAAR